jgi:hypothetical protein
MELAFFNRNSFDSDFNKKCFQTLENILNSSSQGSLSEDVYGLGIKYGQYLKIPILNLHNLMGNFCLQFANNRNKGKSDFLIPEYYGRAINYFKMAGNKEMEDKLNAGFNKIKSDNQLPTVTLGGAIDKDLSAIIFKSEQMKKHHIEGLNTVQMIDFICNDENLIPNNVDPISENHAFDLFRRSNYDINGNFNHAANKQVINPFTTYLNLFTIKQLNCCFKNCIESDKINSEILICHLENNSWLGNTKEGNYWLDLLRPGIASFFSVYKRYVFEPTLSNLEFVLPLDSLATKMEGILRAFAQLNGINTVKIENEKIKGSSGIQTREIFIHELLSDGYPLFKDLFSENEYQFFKTIYLKDGYDIRNNIAHSFYKPKDYTINKLLLVILSIMRISRCNNLAK